MTAANEAKPQQRAQGERQPLRIERLTIVHMKPDGIPMPDGYDGQGTRTRHTVKAGIEGDVKTEIDHRPWLRVFRVTRMRKVTSTGKDGKENVSWVPMGRPFHIPDHLAISVPAEDL